VQPIGAVDVSGLVEVLGDALQTRQQSNHVERIAGPDVGERQRMQRGLGRGEPFDLEVHDVERDQDAIDHPVGIQQQPPDDGDDHSRKEPGQDVERPQDAANEGVDKLAVQHEGEGHADQEVENHAHRREVERLSDRLPENRIVEIRQVVLQSDERGVPFGDRPIHQRISQDGHHGIKHQQKKHKRRWSHIEIGHKLPSCLVGKQAPFANCRLRTHQTVIVLE
jgi:hypothetical protein